MTPVALDDDLAELLHRVCERSASEQDFERLETRALKDTQIYRTYLNYFALHGSLCQSLVTPSAQEPASLVSWSQSSLPLASTSIDSRELTESSMPAKPKLFPLALLGRAATALRPTVVWSVLAVAVIFYGTFTLIAWNLRSAHLGNTTSPQVTAPAPVFSAAELVHADDASWKQETVKNSSATKTLHVNAGMAELTFAQGAKVVVKGPAEFEVRSKNSGFLRRGKLLANVPPQAIGFTIFTPKAEIVDLGTEFGVEVDDEQNAEVHVFRGTVIAREPSSPTARKNEVRLAAGSALRIDNRQARFANIPLNSQWKTGFVTTIKRPVIAKVENNSGREFEIVCGGLVDGKPAYLDEPYYHWVGVDKTGIPRELLGADYVRPSDRANTWDAFRLDVKLAVPATLYVFMDSRGDSWPEWLTKDFVNTGLMVGLGGATGGREGESFVRFAVWKRQVPAGTVVLGRNCPGRVGIYTVAATPDFGGN